MDGCIFCRIVSGEIPAEIVYDNDLSMAFLDIKPVNPGHVVIVPKTHYADFASTPPNLLADAVAVAQKVARAVTAAVGATGFNIGVNNGRDAGQAVDHMHLHVIPRFKGDGHESWHRKAYPEGEAAKVAGAIRKNFENRPPTP